MSPGFRSPSRHAAILILALGLFPTDGRGQIPLIESGSTSLGLSGYVRSLSGIHRASYDPPSGERTSGFHADVTRLKWRARFGNRIVADVHNRLQVTVSSSDQGLGSSVAGFGVSAAPRRSVDLVSVWVDQDRLRVWHDLDRLSLTFYAPIADITIGRQGVTWGTSLLFPVADLWSQFSPFELDTEEKPGIDAIRILAYPTSDLELDVVVADRGRSETASSGIRATWGLASADIYGAVGRFWDEAILLGGVAWLFDAWKVRAEGTAHRDLNAATWSRPRVTLGADWLGSRMSLTTEYHLNGPGSPDPSGYLDQLQGERFARGETYFLGRHYAGAALVWTADEQERIRITGSALVNLGDPSGSVFPAAIWDLGESISISVGGLLAFGEEPSFLGAVPMLGSEYGTYGNLLYLQMSAYF